MGPHLAGYGISDTDLVECVMFLNWHASSLMGPSPQALTLLGGVSLIAWRPRRSFLVECRRDPRHLWSLWVLQGYGPAPGPTLKEALCNCSCRTSRTRVQLLSRHHALRTYSSPTSTNTADLSQPNSVNVNSATGVRTRLSRCRIPTR